MLDATCVITAPLNEGTDRQLDALICGDPEWRGILIRCPSHSQSRATACAAVTV